MAVDDAEFSEFLASQYTQLCWQRFLLTGSRTEAEELAQEALVRTWWRWQLVRRPVDPASFARRVLVTGTLAAAPHGGGGAVAGAVPARGAGGAGR